jgi:hypothetical protein
VKFADWPEIDRELWEAGVSGRDGLDDPAYGAGLQPATRARIVEGYGRWLGFLALQNDLDPAEHPARRVTVARVRAFFRLLRELGNRDHTVVSRLVALQRALRIMVPGAGFGWLTAPGGTTLQALLPMTKRVFEVPRSRMLFDWGLALMDTAPAKAPVRRRVQYRDGLMIAILAARAPRLRAVAAMHLGRHVVRNGARFRLVFEAADIKTKRAIEYDLPAVLTPYIERYLAVERRELLGSAENDAFWVNWGGKPLGLEGVGFRIRWWSEKKFGEAFGPHRFRHALGTTAPSAAPIKPGIAPAILGISTGVLERNYNRAGEVEAIAAFHINLREERAATKGLARRVFRRESR